MQILHIAFPLELSFQEYVSEVPGNDRLLAPKKLDHLLLREPDGLALQVHAVRIARFANTSVRYCFGAKNVPAGTSAC